MTKMFGAEALASTPPTIDAATAQQLVAQHFGIQARLERLPGEREINFVATASPTERYILKVSAAEESLQSLQLQTQALLFLAQADASLAVPRVVLTKNGQDIATAQIDAHVLHLRLQTYLEGTPALSIKSTPASRRSIGRLAARLDTALTGFFSESAGRALAWDLRTAGSLLPYVDLIASPTHQDLARRTLQGFEARVKPQLLKLPRQIIHNDFNQNNVLIDESTGQACGILDFGDMVQSSRINELAIAIAHQLYGQDDPLTCACDIIAAYCLELPLQATEIGVLLDLVKVRLVTREVVAAWRANANPAAPMYDDTISQWGWAAAQKLDTLDSEEANKRFFAAAGLPYFSSDDKAREGTDVDAARLLALRDEMLGPMYKKTFYNRLFFPTKGFGVTLTDNVGRTYLDAYNNVPHVGHCHPYVVSAVSRQLKLLNTHTRYIHDNILEYAEKLSATLPSPLNVCLFVCSGTEANELAWRIACANSGGDGALITPSAFHGNSTIIAELDSSTLPHNKLKPWVAMVDAPEMAYYRPDRIFPDANTYAQSYERAISQLNERGHKPAALFACSAFASDGLYSPPAGYLDAAMSRVRASGALIVSDEVQSGLGRPGTHMWGFEHAGFVPDIVTMGKPMGNGLPLAVVVTRRELIDKFLESGRYFNTFGGNPVVCAAGSAVLDVIAQEGLQQNALDVGTYMREGIASLMPRHASIGDVRGSGLFIGAEIVEERGADVPAPALARDIIEGMLERGVVIGLTGPHRNLLKIRPPMVFSRSDADKLIHTLDQTLTALRN